MPKKITYDEFLRRSLDKHGDKFNYDEVEYINQYTPIKIKCPIHGYFEQIPKSHMSGNDCKKCSQLKIADKLKGVKKINKLDKETVIDRLKKIYNYDYSKCEIEDSGNKAIIKNIICPKHGFFNKRLNNHLRQKQGCNICGSNKSNTEDFIEKSKIIHQNKYDYSKTDYINDRTKLEIICPTHGPFHQIPNKHLYGQGCPDCYRLITSKGEAFIRKFLSDNNIKFECQKGIPGTKLKFDFFLPHKNMFIEYDGIQHYEPRSRFGGEKEYLLQINRDKLKNNFCEENNIELLRIGYKDYKKLNQILIDKVLNENKIIKFSNFFAFLV